MATERNRSEPVHDDRDWSIVADWIERRDRGERVDPAEFDERDPALARRLRDCLAGFGWLQQALSGGSSGGSEPRPDTYERMPTAIGEYNLIRELGRGGMGVVYEAIHQSLGRRVALKVLFDSACQSPTARDRFLREARTAASLHHTNIVPVFDSGSADGHLYYAMQLIEGRSLDGSRTERLDSREVARLGLQAAEALVYAHSRGIIHRDIKPSNLLTDSSGTLWITDFGLARGPEDPSVTASGARVGTPRYMSPEQATAQWESLDARTDIYSLGVSLYEILTGAPLFPDSTPPQLLLRIIRTEPSRVRQLNRRVPRDLETIVMKAMAKRPADRYASAQELADDLRRFLQHQPVRARRIGPLGRFVRWCRREPVLAGVTVAAAMTIAAVVATYQVQLAADRDAAIDSEKLARTELAESLFQQARATRGTNEIGRRWKSLDLLARSAAIQPRPELGLEAVRALELYDARCVRELHELGGPVGAVAFRPAGRQLAIATDARAAASVCVWDDEAGAVVSRLAAPAPVHALAFSPDGRRLAGATEQHLCLWDLPSGQLRLLPGGAGGLTGVTFTPDGQRLVGFAGGLCVWDVASGEIVRKLTDSDVEIGLVATSPGASVLAAAVATPDDAEPIIRRWSLADLEPLAPLRIADHATDPLVQAAGVLAMSISPGGRWLAASCGDSRVRLWNVATGRQVAVLAGHRVPVVSIAFAANDDLVITSDGFEVKLWSAEEAVELATLIQPTSAEIGPLPAVATSRDGRLATAGDVCRIWELAVPNFHRVLARRTSRVQSLATSPDGRVAAWLADGRLSLWNWSDAKVRRELPVSLEGDGCIAWAQSARSVIVASAGSTAVQVVDAETGEVRARWPAESASAIAAHPDGSEVAIAHTDNIVRRWNVATGQVTAALVGHVGPVMSLAYSPDGRWLAAGNDNRDQAADRTLFVWEVASGRMVHAIAAHRAITFGAAFSPDGRQLASCGGDGIVRIWDCESGKLVATLRGHSQAARGVAFSPDGSRLAASGLDGRLLIWNVETGRLLADLASRACGSLHHVAFGPDGYEVLAAGGPYRWMQPGPGAVECWNIERIRQEISPLAVEK
jgi:WD40 repeat protein